MTYFLDFDRTLFDTSAFLAYVTDNSKVINFLGDTEVEMATILNTMVAEGEIHFKDGELAQFMYPDAMAFLDMYSERCVVVTAGNVALQKAKLENVFAVYPQVQLVYTGDDRKGSSLVQLTPLRPKPWIFIDDKPMELESVSKELPEVSLFQMCRNGLEPNGAYTPIRSFSELP